MNAVTPAHAAAPGAPATRRFGVLSLRPHPAAAPGPVRAVSASGSIDAAGRLQVEFELHGDLRAIRIAAPRAAPGRRDELWQHTCFEVFARRAGDDAYLEFNFAPSGDWAAYRFSAYRAGRHDASPLEIAATAVPAAADRWRLQARAAPVHADSALGLSAVIEALDGTRSYWALHHPRAQPDFHDFAGFSLLPGAAPAGQSA